MTEFFVTVIAVLAVHVDVDEIEVTYQAKRYLVNYLFRFCSLFAVCQTQGTSLPADFCPDADQIKTGVVKTVPY